MMKQKTTLLSLHRLEGLTDGIFAIIITIMVLGIEVPDISTSSSSMELFHALQKLLPQIISYSISFYLIAHFWLSNIHQLKMCVCTNRTHILLIFLYIFFVSFIPFTTTLVGNYSEIRLAVAIFHFSVLLVYIASLISWVFVSNNENIISQKIDKETIKFENIIHAYRLSIPILGIVISMWQPMYSYFVYLLMAVGTNLIRRSYPNTYSSCSAK